MPVIVIVIVIAVITVTASTVEGREGSARADLMPLSGGLQKSELRVDFL